MLSYTSVNARVLDALIKVGAMQSFGGHNALLTIFPNVLKSTAKDRKDADSGQIGLFSNPEAGTDGPYLRTTPLPEAPPMPTAEKLKWEKELLGIYFTSHPIQDAVSTMDNPTIFQLGENDLREGASVKGISLIKRLKTINTKKGMRWLL